MNVVVDWISCTCFPFPAVKPCLSWDFCCLLARLDFSVNVLSLGMPAFQHAACDLNFSRNYGISEYLRKIPYNLVSLPCMRAKTWLWGSYPLPCQEMSISWTLLCYQTQQVQTFHQNSFPLSPPDSLTLFSILWRTIRQVPRTVWSHMKTSIFLIKPWGVDLLEQNSVKF